MSVLDLITLNGLVDLTKGDRLIIDDTDEEYWIDELRYRGRDGSMYIVRMNLYTDTYGQCSGELTYLENRTIRLVITLDNLDTNMKQGNNTENRRVYDKVKVKKIGLPCRSTLGWNYLLSNMKPNVGDYIFFWTPESHYKFDLYTSYEIYYGKIIEYNSVKDMYKLFLSRREPNNIYISLINNNQEIFAGFFPEQLGNIPVIEIWHSTA
jgi:hypothetical protein